MVLILKKKFIHSLGLTARSSMTKDEAGQQLTAGCHIPDWADLKTVGCECVCEAVESKIADK